MWKVIGSRHNKSICSISSVLCVQKLFRDASAHYLHSTPWPEVFSCIFLHMKDIGPHSHRYPSTYLTLSIGKDELPELRTAVEVHREMLYLQSHPTCPAMGGNNLGSVSTPSLAVRIEKLVLALFLVCTVTLTNHRPPCLSCFNYKIKTFSSHEHCKPQTDQCQKVPGDLHAWCYTN